jgi:uncharacterized delta-60 repeat protein
VPTAGSLFVHGDGTVDYSHSGGPGLVDTFTYTIADVGGARSNVATVTMTTQPVVGCGQVVLDRTWGGDGTVNAVTPGTNYDDQAYAAALQPDGKVITAGQYYRNAPGRTATFTRFDARGTPDPTFGGDGFAEGLFNVGSAVYGLAVLPDGRVLGAGEQGGQLMFVRLLADGRLDPSFGGAGVVTVPGVAVGYQAHRMLALQPDGMAVAVGTSNNDMVVVRVDVDGDLDPGFGAGGLAVHDLGGVEAAYTVLLQADGGVVAGGTSDGDFGLLRLLPDGSRDPNFSGGSVVLDVTGAVDEVYGLTEQGADIVAVGCGDCTFNYLYDTGWALARVSVTGVPDPAFGAGGVVFDPIPGNLIGGNGANDRAYAAQGLADGSVVVAGQQKWNDGAGRMLLARYQANGTVDVCFDGDGYYPQTTWDVFSQGDAAHEVLVSAAGGLVVVGSVNPSAAGAQGVMRTVP